MLAYVSSLLSRHSPALALVAVVGFILPTAALAEDVHHGVDHNQIDGVRFDVHGNIDHWGMFGLGGRVEFPLVKDGLIGGNVHDELALSLGADLLFSPVDHDYYTGTGYVIPIGALQWNFYLGPDWSIFPEAGVALHMGFDNYGYGDRAWFYPQPDLGFGARYHFDSRLALLMRISTPGGLQVGLNF